MPILGGWDGDVLAIFCTGVRYCWSLLDKLQKIRDQGPFTFIDLFVTTHTRCVKKSFKIYAYKKECSWGRSGRNKDSLKLSISESGIRFS